MNKRRWLLGVGCAGFVLWICLLGLGLIGLFIYSDSRKWSDQLVTAQAGEDSHLSLAVGDETRTYLLHLPPQYDGSTPLPLVLALHGGSGNAEQMAETSQIAPVADEEGFIVVYPNGSGRVPTERLLTWNAGGCCAYAMEEGIDDVVFLRALIAELTSTLAVDSERVYMTGISNGGMMSLAAACELSDVLTGIASQVGALMWDDCQPEHPLSILMINGQEDETIPYAGGDVKIGQVEFTVTPIPETIAFWVAENGCETTPATTTNTEGNVITDTYTGCEEEVSVRLITVTDGGHGWYGADRTRLRGDAPSNAISSTEEIWRFFAGE